MTPQLLYGVGLLIVVIVAIICATVLVVMDEDQGAAGVGQIGAVALGAFIAGRRHEIEERTAHAG